MATFQTVDAYVASFPPDVQAVLQDVRRTIRKAAPTAEEAISYDIPAYKPDSSFVTSSIGVNGVIGPHIGVSLAYYYVSGRSGIKEDGLSGVLSYRF